MKSLKNQNPTDGFVNPKMIAQVFYETPKYKKISGLIICLKNETSKNQNRLRVWKTLKNT